MGRLDDKFEEVLEARGELRERLLVQEEAKLAAQKVMDIFKYTIDGLDVQSVLMSEGCNGMCSFSVQAPDGEFRKYELSDRLSKALEAANGRLTRKVRKTMLELLEKYFDIRPGASGTVISMKN
mgnify:CR=1 FL=1